MITFIDTYRDQFGVELICRALLAAIVGFLTSLGYRAAKTRVRSSRAIRYEILITELRTMHEQNFSAYGHQEDARRDAPARLAAGPGVDPSINAAGGIEGCAAPAAGAPSTGENPCNNKLPNRSPGTTPRRPRSADVASDWRSGDDRQDTTRQRTSTGTPPARPDPEPSTTPRRCRSSGPPTPPRGARVHRRTPTASGQHRSGRTGLTPAQ